MATVRIDKYLSVALNVSRTDAKQLLRSGKVSVDGKIISKGDSKIEETASVTVSGEPAVYKKYIYIVMNKPEGILSAATDKRIKTVVDILPESLKREGLFPVGRLDKNTTGLLILTNDGDFGHKVTAPKTNTEKCYLAELDGSIKDEDILLFEKGVTLADGELCKPAILRAAGEHSAYVTVTEGKYHQIKRMFGVVGLGVNKLHRVSIGKLTLPEELSFGEARELTEEERLKIFDKNLF
jgi:16S rRNA pseudouridine516 synthase